MADRRFWYAALCCALVAALIGYWAYPRREENYSERAEHAFDALRKGDFASIVKYIPSSTCRLYGLSDSQLRDLFERYIFPIYSTGQITARHVTDESWHGVATAHATYHFDASPLDAEIVIQLHRTDYGHVVGLEQILYMAWAIKGASQRPQVVVKEVAREDRPFLESLGLTRYCESKLSESCRTWDQTFADWDEQDQRREAVEKAPR